MPLTRRLHVVGGVAPGKRPLQSLEHRVQSKAQPAHLGPRGRWAHAPGKLAGGNLPRGGLHPIAGSPTCTADAAAPRACLVVTLDALGFQVTGGTTAEQDRRLAMAVAVVQLDAGLPRTGRPDDAFLRYLGIAPAAPADAGAEETRTIGTSAQGRLITAYRYGRGARVVLVVAETHGDEEGGLRVWLRARREGFPPGSTTWVVPMLNPDGLALDTRFLADGTDPNRAAPARPEQRAVVDFAAAIRPQVSVWYHQNYGWIGGSGASMKPAERYHELTGLGALKHSGNCRLGFVWCPIDAATGASSILVELPDVLTPADVKLHARALLALATDDPPNDGAPVSPSGRAAPRSP